MATEISSENGYPANQTRVLPEWMTKKNAVSPSKNVEPITSIEASSTQENGSAKIEEQDVKEEKLCQIVNENSVQSKAHQLSDEEEEKEEKVKGEEGVCEEQETVCKKTNDVSEKQNRVPGEDNSPEKEEVVDAVGEEVPSGEASTQSQDSNKSGVQKITWRVLCDYGAKCYRLHVALSRNAEGRQLCSVSMAHGQYSVWERGLYQEASKMLFERSSAEENIVVGACVTMCTLRTLQWACLCPH